MSFENFRSEEDEGIDRFKDAVESYKSASDSGDESGMFHAIEDAQMAADDILDPVKKQGAFEVLENMKAEFGMGGLEEAA